MKKKIQLWFYYLDYSNNKINKLEDRNIQVFGYELNTLVKMHEFYKIDDESLLLVTSDEQNQIYFIFIDAYEWYRYLNIRTYRYNL